MADGEHVLDRAACTVCGACARECHAGVLEIVGQERTVEEVLAEVLSDRAFYEASGGGLTLSGGEPMMQPAFTTELLAAAKAEGLHCCVETSGYCDAGPLERLRGMVDLFLYDIKETDAERHRQMTGVSNERILENLRRLHDAGAEILLRCPIVPGVNDRADHFHALARLTDELPRLQGAEIVPYHRLGEGKLVRLGLAEAGRLAPESPSTERVSQWADQLRGLGVRVVNK